MVYRPRYAAPLDEIAAVPTALFGTRRCGLEIKISLVILGSIKHTRSCDHRTTGCSGQTMRTPNILVGRGIRRLRRRWTWALMPKSDAPVRGVARGYI